MRTFSAVLASACFVIAGCGAQDPETPEVDPKVAAEQRAREEARQKLMAEEPKAPYDDAQRHAFRAPDGCGQGPYRFQFDALSAPLGEHFSVYACAPRGIKGDYRIVRDDQPDKSEARSFGYGQDNQKCVATEAEVAQSPHAEATHAEATEAPAKPSKNTTEKQTGKASSGKTATSAAPRDLKEVAAAFEECPDGMLQVHLIGHSFASYSGPALPKGRKFTVEVWSATPNDLTGVFFVVAQRGVRAETTPEAWREYLDQSQAWYKRYRAFSDEEVAAGRSHWIDDSAQAATPPPAQKTEARPPSPSVHAEWVAGYWHKETDWVWLPGFWRVPQADVDADLTTHAPEAPPSADKEEARAPRPSDRAVWTSGYWQWDGGSYVWVNGAWRIPPSTEHNWERPVWRRGRSGVVLVPGGWTVTVRRRRR